MSTVFPFLLQVFLLLPSSHVAAASAPGPGDHKFRLKHDGLRRTYLVHVPPGLDPRKPAAVVIYLHGGGGNEKSAFADKLDQTADKQGFLLAVPAGMGERRLGRVSGKWNGGAWEGGRCCGDADDLGFLSAMIDEIKTHFAVDEKRVYAAGISNGGLMANRLACDLAEKIAAVATVAPGAVPQPCQPSRPISVMDIHGTADTCNPFDGGPPANPICRKSPYSRMTPAQVLAAWRKTNRCSERSAPGYARGGASCVRYTECAEKTEVEFCKVENMGHAWPGGAEFPLLGVHPVSHDITSDRIWEFFKRNPRP